MPDNKEWVRLRRALVDHIRHGYMTMNEFTVYCMLKLLADEQTGRLYSSSPAIYEMLHRDRRGMTQRVAMDVIKRLVDKQYIGRDKNDQGRSGYLIWICELPNFDLENGVTT